MISLYGLFDAISRGFNKFVMVPGVLRTFKAHGDNVAIGRRFEISGNENITFGHDVYIGPNAMLLSTHASIKVGNYVMAGPNLTIVTGDHRTDVLDKPMMMVGENEKLPENDRDVLIGDDVWLGSGVTLLKGVEIASHCVVASGAVVTKDVGPEYSVWGGVPAHLISKRKGSDLHE